MASRPPMNISHLSIDIVSGRDPVQGTLDDGAGCRRPFVGWIELTSAVERARGATPETFGDVAGPPSIRTRTGP